VETGWGALLQVAVEGLDAAVGGAHWAGRGCSGEVWVQLRVVLGCSLVGGADEEGRHDAGPTRREASVGAFSRQTGRCKGVGDGANKEGRRPSETWRLAVGGTLGMGRERGT
jgi:hypothetical protein